MLSHEQFKMTGIVSSLKRSMSFLGSQELKNHRSMSLWFMLLCQFHKIKIHEKLKIFLSQRYISFLDYVEMSFKITNILQ